MSDPAKGTNTDGGNKPPSFPSLDQILKAIGVGGGVLYVALFLSYRNYYRRLHVTPEEVGVNNLFILARSLGFIALMAIFALFFLAAWFMCARMGPGAWTKAELVRVAAYGALFVVALRTIDALAQDVWPAWLRFTVGGVPLCAVLALGVIQKMPTWMTALAISIPAVAVPAAAVMARAEDLGKQARRGEEVEPFTLLGLPVVDVSSVRATLNWIGPPQQKPPGVFGESALEPAKGFVVGQGSGTTVFVVRDDEAGQLLRVPSNMISMQMDTSAAPAQP